MARQARLDAPGTLHHVMIRGIEGRKIFQDDQDRRSFLDRIDKLVEETGTRILAWALMENHAHILLFSGPRGLSHFMRRLLTGYARTFNQKYKRYGHLFQDRYKSIVCEKDSYLLELVRYIHLNPVRKGLISNLSELEKYRWSGHAVLTGKINQAWQETDYVLQQFSDKPSQSIRAYKKFVRAGIHQGRRLELVGGRLRTDLIGWSKVLPLNSNPNKRKLDPRVLGSEDFLKKILNEADDILARQIPSKEKFHTAEQIIRKICQKNNIFETELKMGGRRRIISKIRAEIAFQLRTELGLSAAEIARQLGVCSSAIIKAVAMVESEKKKC